MSLNKKNIHKSAVFVDGLDMFWGRSYKVDFRHLKGYLKDEFKSTSFNYFGTLDLGKCYDQNRHTHGPLIKERDFSKYPRNVINGLNFVWILKGKGYNTFMNGHKDENHISSVLRERQLIQLQFNKVMENIEIYDTFIFVASSMTHLKISMQLLKNFGKKHCVCEPIISHFAQDIGIH